MILEFYAIVFLPIVQVAIAWRSKAQGMRKMWMNLRMYPLREFEDNENRLTTPSSGY